MNTFFLESFNDSSSLNVFLEAEKIKKEIDKEKEKADDKVAFMKEKGKEVLKLVKSIYSLNEKELLETATISRVIKVGIRATLVYGVFLANPVAGVIGYVTDKYLSKKVEINDRKKLMKAYEDKLEYIKNKIEKTENDEEKYKLIKIRSSLESNIKKLSLFDIRDDHKNQ